jgi:hypothetical protein
MWQTAKNLSLTRRDEFHVKNSATISPLLHLKRKLPGALGEPTKNAPAIANVRVQKV